MTIESFCASRLAGGRSLATVAWYRQLLSSYERISGHAVAEATPQTVESYLAGRRAAGLQPSTLSAHFRALRSFFIWAERRGFIAAVPTHKVDSPRIPRKRSRRATLEQYMKLLQSCAGPDWLSARDRVLLMLGFFSGLRVTELATLHVADLDVEHGVLTVRAGKNGDSRLVPIHPDVRAELLTYLYSRPVWNGPELFISSDGAAGVRGAMTHWGVRQMLERRCAAAGMAYLNPHSLRHGFATTLLNAGASLESISHMLGHSSVSFTQRIYAMWLEEGLTREYKDALKRLRP